jgi:hypothetical protein
LLCMAPGEATAAGEAPAAVSASTGPTAAARAA